MVKNFFSDIVHSFHHETININIMDDIISFIVGYISMKELRICIAII